ncbi:hypothetical protein ACRQ5Q_08360 [Bradyrhizobium sp. PMVTL-01]|uniref:hypothetical protein n=1 Tax=Bradyrhizobium sp. PMVTL-01 TaxID=3434999 RepID=UPI003F6F81C0
MDPFNSINPFDRDFAAYNPAVTQPQQQQAEFEPYLDEVPQLDTAALAGVPVSAEGHDQDPLRGIMGEALASSLNPTARTKHRTPEKPFVTSTGAITN